jgi:hypothetical protein
MKHIWQHNYYNKQPNNTRLTQIWKQPNFTWNDACQIIAEEIQQSCRIKNDKQEWEYNEMHMTTIITTNNQTTLDSLNLVNNPIWLGMEPVKLLPHWDK